MLRVESCSEYSRYNPRQDDKRSQYLGTNRPVDKMFKNKRINRKEIILKSLYPEKISLMSPLSSESSRPSQIVLEQDQKLGTTKE